MTDDRRKRGRPKVLEPANSPITVWLTASQHDALIKQAQHTDQSVSKTVRDSLLVKRPRQE
jgi:hypothetical protein